METLDCKPHIRLKVLNWPLYLGKTPALHPLLRAVLKMGKPQRPKLELCYESE